MCSRRKTDYFPLQKAKVLFYSDAREFGGHERMTVTDKGHMAKQPNLDIAFAYYINNRRLDVELRDLSVGRNLTLYPLRVKSEAVAGIRALVWLSRLPMLQKIIANIAPDVVLVS